MHHCSPFLKALAVKNNIINFAVVGPITCSKSLNHTVTVPLLKAESKTVDGGIFISLTAVNNLSLVFYRDDGRLIRLFRFTEKTIIPSLICVAFTPLSFYFGFGMLLLLDVLKKKKTLIPKFSIFYFRGKSSLKTLD